jgi:hypothetical protein
VPTYEFSLIGPAVSLRAKDKNAKRYQRWIETVKQTITSQLPSGFTPTRAKVSVVISNYYTADPPDVDNIIKPILDGMNGVVYQDDAQVYRVTSEKYMQDDDLHLVNPSATLAKAIESTDELLFVVVSWQEEETRIA